MKSRQELLEVISETLKLFKDIMVGFLAIMGFAYLVEIFISELASQIIGITLVMIRGFFVLRFIWREYLSINEGIRKQFNK